MSYDYDLLVLGAGSAGLAASKRAASYGAKVAIIENNMVGGTCVIRGCVPKKFMVYASRFSKLFDVSQSYGWQTNKAILHWNTLRDNVQNEVARLNELHINLLKKANVTLLKGTASFVDEHTIQIVKSDNTHTVSAKHILIATGSKAVMPSTAGMEHAVISDEMFKLPTQPKHIAIIGGGYIGTEFAGIFNGLGTKVTQIIRRQNILRGFDKDIRTIVQSSMQNNGIEILNNTTILRIEKDKTHCILHLGTSEKQNTLRVDNVILSATGRIPNTKNLNLEKISIPCNNNGSIIINEKFQTNHAHIYALGDVASKFMLTPVAIAEGRAFADSLFGKKDRSINYDIIATAIFSQPEAGTVGMSEEDAIEKYGIENLQIYHTTFNSMFYNLYNTDNPNADKEKIFMKLIAEKQSQKIIGAHMVGDSAAEIIQSIAIAITMGATKKDFDKTMALHPSAAEEFVTMT